jgi:hypothetical protein
MVVWPVRDGGGVYDTVTRRRWCWCSGYEGEVVVTQSVGEGGGARAHLMSFVHVTLLALALTEAPPALVLAGLPPRVLVLVQLVPLVLVLACRRKLFLLLWPVSYALPSPSFMSVSNT